MKRTRILVADPLPIFRSAVRNVLARESDLEVVEASDMDGVERAIRDTGVEIALIDLDLPPHGGIVAARAIRERCQAEAIVWSFEPTRATVLHAISAGANGFLHKEISAEGLVRTLRGTLQGEAPLTRDLAALLIDAIHELESRSHALERAGALSAREREVLDHVARGARNKQIAATLTISEFTVKRHVQNILHKLELPSRRAAAAFHRVAFGEEARA